MNFSHDALPAPGRLTYVTATISGDQISPKYWTDFFGVAPTFCVEKGRPFITPVGKQSTGIGKSNIWGYSTKGILTDDLLSIHLEYLILKLKLPRLELKARLDVEPLKFRFTCFFANFARDRRLIIEPKLEEIINKSGGALAIDEYF